MQLHDGFVMGGRGAEQALLQSGSGRRVRTTMFITDLRHRFRKRLNASASATSSTVRRERRRISGKRHGDREAIVIGHGTRRVAVAEYEKGRHRPEPRRREDIVNSPTGTKVGHPRIRVWKGLSAFDFVVASCPTVRQRKIRSVAHPQHGWAVRDVVEVTADHQLDGLAGLT